MLPFLLFHGLFHLFLYHDVDLMLGISFLFLEMFSFLLFCLLTSAFRVVHSSVVCLHVPWYWQNFLTLCSSSESSSSKSLKVTHFLFLDPFLDFILFLEGSLGGIDFSRFLIIFSKNSVIEWIGPSKLLYPCSTIFFFHVFGIAWYRISLISS